jgi:DNA repair protein RadC
MPERGRRPEFGEPAAYLRKSSRRNRSTDVSATDGELLYVQHELPGLDADEPVFTFDDERAQGLQRALAAFNLDVVMLRELAAQGQDVFQALRSGAAPPEVHELLAVLASLLRPLPREQIRSPVNAAALLMTEMGYLDQEQLRVLCLDTKNRLQKIHLVYQGSLNTSLIRVGEIFKEPLRLNSAAIILAHNHPSSDPTPSHEDALVTQEIVQAGNLLDVDVLDHLVIGQGRWISMRERGLGFSA